MLSEEVVVFDNLAGALTLVVNADTQKESAYALAVAQLDALGGAIATDLAIRTHLPCAP